MVLLEFSFFLLFCFSHSPVSLSVHLVSPVPLRDLLSMDLPPVSSSFRIPPTLIGSVSPICCSNSFLLRSFLLPSLSTFPQPSSCIPPLLLYSSVSHVLSVVFSFLGSFFFLLYSLSSTLLVDGRTSPSPPLPVFSMHTGAFLMRKPSSSYHRLWAMLYHVPLFLWEKKEFT